MTVVSRMASLAFAAVALLLFTATDARAGFDNPAIVDIANGSAANRGTDCQDGESGCRSRRALDRNNMFFLANGTTYAYGTLSNSNGQAGPDYKRGVVFWRIQEPESIRRTNRGANMTQRKNIFVNVGLYTYGGVVFNNGDTGDDTAELCGAAANASTAKDDGGDVRRVTGRFLCRRNFLEDIGFSDDEIDCLREAFDSRNWRARGNHQFVD